MQWIDDRLTAHRNAVADQQAVTGAADGIFDAVWSEVVAISVAASKKGMRTSTNGSPYDRKVQMTVYPKSGQTSESPRSLRLTLTESKQQIIGLSDAATHEFSIEVCDDGVVSLKLNGYRVDAPKAARLVMEPFLFEGKSPFAKQP